MAHQGLNNARYGPAARRQRNMDARIFGRPEGDAQAIVDPRIEGTCTALLVEWFHRNIFVVFRMPEANEEYLLEHGSLWQEIYVCLVRVLLLDEFEEWHVREIYWARALYCLFIVHETGDATAGRLWHDLLHFVRVPELFIEVQLIVARQLDHFLNERGINLGEEE
eukprot:GHVU01144700.1.p1 GENE.GHVU01144700.1~~GHVU01144700.1.p1  ORF type:complete len:166 (-),score=13.95 GHVU01144700.1:186-683(-)